jgi:hypothetical protein
MNSSMFWDITQCIPSKVNIHFAGTYHLHLQGRRLSQARNQHKSGSKQNYALRGVTSISRKFKFVRVKVGKFVAMVTIRNRTVSQLS